MGLVDVNNSRLSNTLGQGQGQSSTNDVRNAQNLSNYNPNTNYILFQPNNSPSISIGVNQNDSSTDKKSDVDRLQQEPLRQAILLPLESLEEPKVSVSQP